MDERVDGFSYSSQERITMGALNSVQYVQKIKFSIKDSQIRRFLWIWSHLLKKSLMEKFISHFFL